MIDLYDPDPDDDIGTPAYSVTGLGASVTDLMMPSMPSPPQWMELALCEGDPRFTQDDPLTVKDRKQMERLCRECEVFFTCLEYHDPPGEDWRASGVFAAGEYFD